MNTKPIVVGENENGGENEHDYFGQSRREISFTTGRLWAIVAAGRNPPNAIAGITKIQFHTNPIFFKCPSTRAASVSTSAASCGIGVA